ncbi:Probable triacylglycerol lipase [Taphrina deformans PYCC 5710]|uniref:Probable triacylglycerol lipase n=1 Tax=Taphrina deformans (strain PYCC 5710 / ATCC 11124 / CBS 356.35 / IMI 108563 / JCM 9778 / NBRC 8474) TaxID=1097556 RepID=R4X6D9_TAPDE|nr:Probable triacylglycerol lipase [Taphrina deformans PYCC 5710]|eukprot:CCG80605.1 Probable triacylglycerol lipase [Taphrina deformans PYCC 5710]
MSRHSWSLERCIETFLLLGLGLYLCAFILSCGPTTYFLITIFLVISIVTLIWLFLSISCGKWLVSALLRFTRASLALPFRLIRNAPRVVRIVFFEAPVVVIFFIWFRVLVFFDRHILRRALYWAGGLKHASGVRVSSVNAISPSFTPITNLDTRISSAFDIKTGISLANLSKLAYEDEEVIRYELDQAGYDLDHFTIIDYHNTTGYVCLYNGIVVIAFRGTEPLNLMHIMTDLQGGLVSLSSLDTDGEQEDAGKAHYGFLEALRLHRSDRPTMQRSEQDQGTQTLSLNEDDSIGSAFTALLKIGGFLVRSFAQKPMTLNLPRRNGKTTAFEQISEALARIQHAHTISKIYCTGHSLGGALATVYFAQAQLSSISKSLVSKMIVYSFGAPRIGDARFREWMQQTGADRRVYKVVNAQDLVPRMPTLPASLPRYLRHFPYAEGPGTLIHLHPVSSKSPTLEEIPGLFLHKDGHVPPIEFWGLSGLLSIDTIRKTRTESWLWIAARFWIPFVMFDHLASQYALALEDIYLNSDDAHFENQMQLD